MRRSAGEPEQPRPVSSFPLSHSWSEAVVGVGVEGGGFVIVEVRTCSSCERDLLLIHAGLGREGSGHTGDEGEGNGDVDLSLVRGDGAAAPPTPAVVYLLG